MQVRDVEQPLQPQQHVGEPFFARAVKLHRELPGVRYKPFDDELGKRIYDNVSEEAWRMWVEHSKMIVNENRLVLGTPKAHETLHDYCEQYFFGESAAVPPPDYVAPTK